MPSYFSPKKIDDQLNNIIIFNYDVTEELISEIQSGMTSK